ncbi:MAG: DUF2461 domain-containing protein [Exiguobacterium profundum]|nr:MAG: DUF2461 domain-containing protein [Exiguobacterium profundum]
MGFPGIPQATFSFLAGLQSNNNRDWFEAHRADYDRDWLAVGLDLAAALSEPAARLGLMAVPKLNATLRRIHRDTRFSADKRPYHAELHLILSTGPAFNKVPGVHLVFGPTGWGYGAGRYGLSPAALDRWRHAVSDGAERAEIMAWLDRAEQSGCPLDPPDLARVPKGWPGGAGWDHLLRRKSIIARTPGELPLPAWISGPDAVDRLMALVADLAPLALGLARLTPDDS